MIKIIHSGYLGTETPYIYQKSCETLPPSDYKPFFINHLGRHGARYLASDVGVEKLLKILKQAEKEGGLTRTGKQLIYQLERLLVVEEKEMGLLTASGVQMEEGIARRMAQHFPDVFGKEIIAVSTYVERTKESMVAFLKELREWIPESKISASSNGVVDPILRFFDLNKAYLNYKREGKWQLGVKAYAKREDVTTPILTQFFKTDYIVKLEAPDVFVADLYAVYTNQFDARENVGLGMYFTHEELGYLWENENLRQYLEKGPSYTGQCLPTNIAFPLLMDFLSTSERAIQRRDLSAYLRFAHAETIIPFSVITRLLGFFNQTNSAQHVAVLWKDYWVSPMAANVQWIFYEHPSEATILVKVLYNETEVRLPVRSNCAPYYAWEDLKRFYIKALKYLPIDFNEDLVTMVADYTGSGCFCGR